MTRGKCSRCGAEESIFWYPYAFALVPIPDAATRQLPDCQRFMLCDICQQGMINFMRDRPPRYYRKDEPKEAKE